MKNLLLTALLVVASQQPAAAGFLDEQQAEKVSEHVYVIHGPLELPNESNEGFMNNPAFIIGEQGVVIVDPGSSVQVGEMVLGKIAAHWLVTGLPLVLIATVLGLQYDLSSEAIGVLLITHDHIGQSLLDIASTVFDGSPMACRAMGVARDADIELCFRQAMAMAMAMPLSAPRVVLSALSQFSSTRCRIGSLEKLWSESGDFSQTMSTWPWMTIPGDCS